MFSVCTGSCTYIVKCAQSLTKHLRQNLKTPFFYYIPIFYTFVNEWQRKPGGGGGGHYINKPLLIK